MIVKTRQITSFFMVLALGASLAACSTNQATGRSVFTGLMDARQEQATGDQEHPSIVKQYGGISDNAKLNQYIAMIGAKLVPYTERKDMPKYTFTVLNTDDINAFAVPGGYIYVTRGLLNLAQDEAEIAGVMAHELGHIQAQHSAQQYSQTAVANLGVGLLGSVLGGASGQLASQVAGFGAQAGLMKYSREHEYEADSLGIRYIAKAGYDPTAMGRFLQMLERNTEFENSLSGSGGGDMTFLSTHPSTPERITRAFNIAAQYPADDKAEIGRADYLAAIDGTNYGGSPASGFVRGNEFIHPDSGFRFSVPDGFSIQNGESQVLAENGKGAIIVFDMGKGQTNDPNAYLTQTWFQGNATNVENITINGIAAATGTAQVNTSQGQKDGRFIAMPSRDGGQFYRLAYFTPVGQQAAYSDAFRRSTYSFHFMSQAEKNQLKANRVRVVTAQSGDTVASLAKRMVVPDHAVDRFCLLNNLKPDSAITPGQKVKIVAAN